MEIRWEVCRMSAVQTKGEQMTLKDAEARLAMWLEAEEAVAIGGQSYETQGGRKLTRANIGEIRKYVEHYERKVASLSGKLRRGRRVVFRDDL